MAGVKKKRSKRASVMIRYSILLGFMLLVATWVAYNMFRNAIVDSDEWEARANLELSRLETVIEPDRGDILAADGSVLATTLQYYTLRIDFGSEGFKWKEYVAEKDALAEQMHKHFPIEGGLKAWQDSLDSVLRRNRRPRGWRLIHNITYADYMRIKEFPFFKGKKSNQHGLLAEPKKRRANPYGDMAKLSIGYVTEDKNRQKRGYSGLEKALDEYLYGVPGISRKVNFTRGIGNWEQVPAQRGWDVRSTIDVQMQDIVESALMTRLQETHAEWGTAVLMEVATGEIKAMSNLEEDPKQERCYIEAMNRAVRGFEPGSVVKTLSMMVAIEDGYVTNLDSVVEIGRSFPCFGGRPITDSHFNSHLTIRGIIEESSNIGMARVLSKFYTSPQGWHDRIASLGILQPLNSGIYEERTARFPVPANGAKVTLSRQFYGYGCELTPLHTLSIYNAIANNGKFVRPRLVRSLHREGQDSIVPIDYVVPHFCSEKTAEMMRECLYAVCNGEHGTARSLKNPYVKLAGKTGTCYSTQNGGGYDTSRKRLAFCGYFPAENPKYTCMVLIYHPRETAFGAASTSGAVLRNVAMSMYARGMLDNETTLDSGVAVVDTEKKPLAFASADDGLAEVVSRVTNNTPRRYAPEQVASGLPNVCGMGLREAVSVLENAGVDVTFEGVGLVSSQTPPAGSTGSKVHLTLKH